MFIIGHHQQSQLNSLLRLAEVGFFATEPKCTLLDFGAQVTLPEDKEEYYSIDFRGSLYFLAPEICREHSASYKGGREPRCPYSFKSGIYSLGIMVAIFCGQVSAEELKAETDVVIHDCGISVTDQVTDDLKKYLRAPSVCPLFLEFIKLLTHKQVECRPKSMDECVAIFDGFSALILATLQCGNVKIKMDYVKSLLEPLQKLAKTTKVKLFV